jgi:hypothetical protein
VESADLDMTTWQVSSLFVALTDEASAKMGFKRPFLGKVTVCLPVSAVKSITADAAMLNHTLEELSHLKQCKE